MSFQITHTDERINAGVAEDAGFGLIGKPKPLVSLVGW